MEIKRKIGGVDVAITLTDEECLEIYRDMQRENDRGDIVSRIEKKIDEEDFWFGGIETSAEELRALIADSDAVDRMAKELRHTLDNHDGISEALWLACDDVIEDELY